MRIASLGLWRTGLLLTGRAALPDEHRTRRSDAQLDLLRHFDETDPDGDPLGQADPLKGRADLRQEVSRVLPSC